MKQTAQIFCQDPKIRQSQCIDERMKLYDEVLCKTLGKTYPAINQTVNQDCQLEKLPQQNTLLDSFIKNLLMSDKGLLCFVTINTNKIGNPKHNLNLNQIKINSNFKDNLPITITINNKTVTMNLKFQFNKDMQ
ncbi:unnamed protein product (macronuclear) [Paramecium tetraurelia]|uniref:Uncharacterized protein n=1 Tax=Paramecium tetraurelia TaxID=5888 RepID=A0DZT0_PARTE|nr:uncharacterized protein GSPATT00021715001 [Paramecium tetraurelia]CAK88547.1 unnamed protein product [Paramecium tetraurelia]|eukprot:XP_001455944.1 hypothetical protein (macronuclear) [Paramecium tetraurelia strain d4-2]